VGFADRLDGMSHHGRMQQRIILITLGVSDLAASRRFYIDGLGWEPVLDIDEIVFLQAGHGLVLGLWPADELRKDVGVDGPQGPHAAMDRMSLAHNVDSEAEVDAALAEAEAAGATILKPGQRADFGGYHGYFADPDGFRWEIAYNPGLTIAADGKVRIGPVVP